MQGTLTVARFPIRAFAMVLVATAILILGGLGGYLVRGQAPAAASPSSAGQVVAPNSGSSISLSGPAFDNSTHRGGPQD